MIRNIMMASALALVAWGTAPAVAGGCKGCDNVSKTGQGFCCGEGKSFGVTIKSKKLHDALVGQKISLTQAKQCPCDNRAKAVAGNGSCDKCRLTGSKMYGSRAAYLLAKGQPMSKELIAACPKRCNQCKIAFKEGKRCERCKVGFVGDRMFENEKDYRAALAAFETLKKAAVAAQKCEACAVALVTDGKCERCNVKFKDGRMAKSGD